MSSTSVIKKFDFAAAHRLFETVPKDHPCNNLHGHNYECELEIVTGLNREMIIDFSKLKKVINIGMDWWDHRTILNSLDPLRQILLMEKQRVTTVVGDPTVENMTFCLAHLLMHELTFTMDFSTVKFFTLRMNETPNSIGTYTWTCKEEQCRIHSDRIFLNEDIICYL